jgi:transcriptional antiterminator RfaH
MALTDRASTEHWYAVRTKPGQESRAESNLALSGIETLLPKVLVSMCDKVSTRRPVHALFPGYIFAKFQVSEAIRKVRLTRGVKDVVGLGECATPIDDSVIELIRSRIGASGCITLDEPRKGDAIRIASGPLRSLVGAFERRDGNARVVLLLTAIQAHSAIHGPRASLPTAQCERPRL